ncbi:hypothetical protein A3C89_00970 [Candidatus Kaiserbacteria bacterium RIFCSPHIGHO2_02_FULL_50_50]|uniref:Disulfide bond formation protein B n=1 Tax=Candidatus Kaiserbacteria bacterium RIFCSPHIGHO2_02_FULL_50_50 TaxID=1798492 RepID=A0A1F6DDM6_9BACT|nr:MAG: hypothetical protein A3C89_00970 [Candidatus Kaiserbacteria bacterium RIFCSPHIGHO2_02_FULL_50_50]OGG89293.1 MAG: hypothetical protein A3G62_01440 [Candidatus Kaiserbacteria bacterium RIFCSPLOWO2_12_FULL_50_10]
MLIETLNLMIASGALVMLVALAVLSLDLFFTQGKHLANNLAPYALYGILALTLSGTAMSLFYSEVLGFIPCALCWLQRVFLYPQALMAAGSAWWKDSAMLPRYGILLSIAGLLVSLYQYVYQMLPQGSLPCPASGTIDCLDKVINEFGFMTFPLVSAITFVFLIVLYILFSKTRTS